MVEREYKKRNLTMKFLSLFIVRISILISNKGSEKGSDSVDLYCDVVKFRKSRIALNQGFYRLVTCSESLFNFCKEYLKSILVVTNLIKSRFISY